MSSKIILKKSSVPSKAPLPGDLSYGELALNYADGQLYYKDSNNEVKPLINKIVGLKSYTETIGDGVTTTFNVTHNLNTTNIVVQVYDALAGALVEVGVESKDLNSVSILFAYPPTQNSYKVVVLG